MIPFHWIVLISILVLVLFLVGLLLFRRVYKDRVKLTALEEELAEAELRVQGFEDRYSMVIDIEAECLALQQQVKKEIEALEEISKSELENLEVEKVKSIAEQSSAKESVLELKEDYRNKKLVYDSLVQQIAVFSDDIELIELGFYEPKFDFDASEKFKSAIKASKEAQKLMLRDKSSEGAIYCDHDWVVEGSRAEGKKMTNKGIRLTARAFNNECEAAIASCTWKNVTKMEERLRKAFLSINQLNESNAIRISEKYLEEKLKELQLTHEYREKRHQEKEEQAEIRAQMREEARAEAEIRKAEADAIKEEKRYQKALDAARKELDKATDEEKAVLEKQILELQENLAKAESKHIRAQSMAEQTKRGHVYVISNIGSFGEGIYKIGMTRRIEPLDRVKELGDASVPFTFDVHAMIHTSDAPSLEKALHEKFDSRRLNMVNRRKEFFGVSLDEIKDAVVAASGENFDFIETAVAKDFRESVSMRKAMVQRESLSNVQGICASERIPQFANSI